MSVISIRSDGGVPIYQQLKDEVIRLACQGILAPGEQLPSVRSLARELGINPNTVSRAYQELEAEGVIYSMGGRGSFIADSTSAAAGVQLAARNAFTEAAEKARQVGIPRDELDCILDTVWHNVLTDTEGSSES